LTIKAFLSSPKFNLFIENSRISLGGFPQKREISQLKMFTGISGPKCRFNCLNKAHAAFCLKPTRYPRSSRLSLGDS
jgi:hypothetical protein